MSGASAGALAPLRSRTRYVEKVWAGGLIRAWASEAMPLGVGEVWLVSDVEGSPTLTEEGQSLREVVAADPLGLLGPRELAAQEARGEAPRFPYLIKLLDIGRPLSVQLHPDAACAQALGDGERGKSEAWLVLDTCEESEVLAGAPAHADPAALIAAAEAGSLDALLDRFRPEPGEGFPILPGTLHTARGLLVLEAQETSDVTYRVFDWGRGRELHLEQARVVLERLGVGGRPPLAGPWAPGQRELAPGCPFRLVAFEAEAGTTIPLGPAAGPVVLVGLRAEWELVLRDERSWSMCRGETLIVPAGLCAESGWGRLVARGSARCAYVGPQEGGA